MSRSSLTLPALVLRYAIFAVIATVANLGTQRLIMPLAERMPAWLDGLIPPALLATGVFGAALVLGTFVGLVIKYVLDKKWIFFDAGTGLKQHGAKFGLYTAMGLVTTAIFWGTESLFWFVWHTQAMRELGAVLGLAVGYVVKYRLDRRFVFTDAVLHRGAVA
ncbi:putative flippase GtrA [Novosphingobium chloroacetimidivorans]|uniref:Putative flippase GtrA n=1 Tax=Novosphingobium chloroacetimidivorans TaxID=1428314 RepID=A0A7W7K7Q7_9SPHN|nr:GtrA family protein [Novosphingobium chloroacetimidivorans]MBB4857431.1 putative flippase GtrA [Novosphingobium chloroacetimidivorans]